MLHLIKNTFEKNFFLPAFFLHLFRLAAQQSAIKIPIIIDTDSANEIDDLFALVRVLGEPRVQLLGISSAQFHQSPYATTDTALESHKLNQELLELIPQFNIRLVRGSAQPLKNIKFPQQSEASDFIIQQAKKLPKEQKLHLIILGSCTNIASALIQAPEIVNKLQVYYIGFWHDPIQNTYNKKNLTLITIPKQQIFF